MVANAVHRHSAGVVARAPAKLNLFFEVLFRRADGFHEIETLMVPVSLYDTLELRDEPTGRISFSWEWGVGLVRQAAVPLGDIPEGSDNLVVKAVELLRHRAGIRRGAVIRLVKRVPVAAGLGGGSSDAAAALVAADAAWNLGWSGERLAALAAELGSDVPFFLARSAAICRGRGEKVDAVRTSHIVHAVLVCPPVGLSTAEVYRACRPAEKPWDCGPLARALGTQPAARLGRLLFNRLQPAAESLSPWIGNLKKQFDKLDLPGHQMTGSGSGYFGICAGARQARRTAEKLRALKQGIVFAVRTAG